MFEINLSEYLLRDLGRRPILTRKGTLKIIYYYYRNKSRQVVKVSFLMLTVGLVRTCNDDVHSYTAGEEAIISLIIVVSLLSQS